MPQHILRSTLALPWLPCQLPGRELQYRFDAGAPQDIDEIVDGHLALLQQFQ
jgi:hypothetical protein